MLPSNSQEAPASARALLPIMLFLCLFIGVGSYLHWQGVEFAFYQLPASIAIIPAIVLAIILSKHNINQAIEQFVGGMSNHNIITMCLIYLLAGAFSAVAKASGGAEAVVNLALNGVPSWFLLPGIFVVAGLIATAMGTSMGTIAAVAPIALGIAQTAEIDPVYMAGAVLGGAMFGDNLSIISDTTIAATRTQGCAMKDKFRQNLGIALPAALLTIVLLFVLNDSAQLESLPINNPLSALPYLVILLMAVFGVNVFVVLFSGIVLAGGTAMLSGDYPLLTFGKDIYTGFSGMQEIFLLSLFIGGLSALMREQGGLRFIQQWVGNRVNKAKSRSFAAQNGIALITALTNLAVANNTVAILVAGDLTKQLAKENEIEAARSASLMDIFACVIQGLIPYGAQALLIGSLFSLSPIVVVSAAWYPMFLAAVAILVMLRRK
ncbi:MULTISPECIES: Na+/H+ antiporter NhaC family protein [unclassified Agarivorans]|nr:MULTISPECIES: Na+/H+ antiporter NhaC family protein [unclassified Agarivorans]MDO6684435.1 Na+/H+ antiporter NhaC family protein [Agarivorans sp. 3_MG-2023]MDO6714600.1 Na+/H+ antiporter NhaC family protein [Agarivorans sp. 2_MG-2023]